MSSLLERLRVFYNACLQERRLAHKAGVKVNLYTQEKAITVVKNDPDCQEYAGVHTHLLQDVVSRVARAYDGFFRRLKAGAKNPGFPRFKGVGRLDTFLFKGAGHKNNGAQVVAGGARVRLHGIGNVKMKQHREMEGKLKTIGVTRDKCGHWYALITRDAMPNPLPATGQSVGIDLGILNFAALSDGAIVANPRPLVAMRIKFERSGRRVSRRKAGSARRRKAVKQHAKNHAHAVNIRRDFQHKTARAIVEKYDRIAIEDLNVKGLVAGMLAHHARDAAWGQFASFLTSKAEDAGREVVRVDPSGTSQECSGCGERVPKALSVRVHDCPHCGLRVDRDVNAARNIHDRAFAVTGPGRGLRGGALPQQTPTIREAAA